MAARDAPDSACCALRPGPESGYYGLPGWQIAGLPNSALRNRLSRVSESFFLLQLEVRQEGVSEQHERHRAGRDDRLDVVDVDAGEAYGVQVNLETRYGAVRGVQHDRGPGPVLQSDPIGLLRAHRNFRGAGVDQKSHARAVDLAGADEVAARARSQHDVRALGRCGRAGHADRYLSDAQALPAARQLDDGPGPPPTEINVTPLAAFTGRHDRRRPAIDHQQRALSHDAAERDALRPRRPLRHREQRGGQRPAQADRDRAGRKPPAAAGHVRQNRRSTCRSRLLLSV